MNSDETFQRPLHVRVAEALGWWDLHDTLGSNMIPGEPTIWIGHPPGVAIIGASRVGVPRYDTDWEVMGPVIFNHRISILADETSAAWMARVWDIEVRDGGWKHNEFLMTQAGVRFPTPIQAACYLILVMKACGKL